MWYRGESGVGRWTIIVRDTISNENHGTFVDWRLKFWGESIDASKATLLPMPDEHDDEDHDIVIPLVSTVFEGVHPEPTSISGNPSDHPSRPTKPGSPSGTDNDLPMITDATGTEDELATSTDVAQTSPTSSSSWISWFPTFGASKTAQIWIFGALGLIVAFCAGLGIYLWVARRRRLRNNPRNNYEFELLNDQEAEGLNSGEKNTTTGRRGRRTRGGELYDAFAGGSDDEEDAFEDYHDKAAGHHSERPGGDEEEQYVVGDESDDEDGYTEKKDSREPSERR